MLTVLEIIKKTTDFLQGKGVENPRLNAEHLIGHALGLKRMQLYLAFERPLTETDLEKIRPLVRRRGQHEPLQYILGETEFFGVTLKVDRRALIPRPETELLVERIVEKLTAPPLRLLDLGTGTGAIALALAHHYPETRATALDISTEAVALAQENAQALNLSDRVEVLVSDWFAAVETAAVFDLIVSNPPYLSQVETDETLEEVRNFEPRQALTPGPSGMEAFQPIMTGAGKRLKSGGLLAMETGIAQHSQLLAWLAEAGLVQGESVPDLTGRPRFVFAVAP